MKKISIIIPFLNEKDWPYKTIQSIYDTADPNQFEIIAINENSKDNYNFSKFPDVRYIKNKQRIGAPSCLQMGVELSQSMFCLILDAHMLFYPNSNWLTKIIESVAKEDKTLWCFVCSAIGYGAENIYKTKGDYYGADLKLFTDKEKNRPCRQIVEPVWSCKKIGLEYPIQIILGANYAFRKDRFLYLHGLKNLKSWGTSEPFLSLKNFFAGGTSKIRTDVKIAHLFRDSAPYSTLIDNLVFNKIYLLKTIFPKELENKLILSMPKDTNFKMAMEQIEQNKIEIEKEKEYYKSIFTKDIYDFCREFNVEMP